MKGRARLWVASIFSLLILALLACSDHTQVMPEGVLVVSQEQQASWIRNFNPLTTAAAARWPTLAGIYEPLFVYNSVKAEYVPWLGLSYRWLSGNQVLRVETRDSVLWSDGKPFSAKDVTFTFKLMKQFPALDRRGVWNFLADVITVDSNTVDFHFSRIYIPGFDEIAAQPIVPEHIWSKIEDPVTYPNENPVATGPFTEVRMFKNQVFELGRNPHYWQKGLPKIEALRFPALPSNDRANLALVFDEIDWAGNFVPAIDRVYVRRDPEHHHYWFPLTGSTIFLYANTTRKPFDDVRVRKALSMAIDRQFLIDVALFGYSRPSDPSALSDAYASWPKIEVSEQENWVRYNPEAARRMLDEAGLVLDSEGRRHLPDGSPLEFEIITVSGWSDWVRACQVIARTYTELGLKTSVRTYDFSAWFQNVLEGNFDLALGWSYEGPTPYVFYRWLMASETVKPVGEATTGNWHRYGSPRADDVLKAFEKEADPVKQRDLSLRLQRIFFEEAPAIPLYPNPSWAEYNARRFVGFPSAENPYADPSPNKFDRGECLLVLTSLRPR